MTKALKSCPFCGSLHAPWLNIDGHYVHCTCCGISSRDYDTNAEAVAGWNRRATPAPAQPDPLHVANERGEAK